jgi:hypothetical protein
MPRVGFESTIPVFERAKVVHDLDRAGTVFRHFIVTAADKSDIVPSVTACSGMLEDTRLDEDRLCGVREVSYSVAPPR